ncbi:hypothetical protein EJD97_024627, partial [Solanum chilense]
IIFTEEELNVMDETILNLSPSHHNSEEQGISEKQGVDVEQKCIELKAEISDKPQTDQPSISMAQIIALDPILNATTTPDVQKRHINPRKYESSPYIRLSKVEAVQKEFQFSSQSNIHSHVKMILTFQQI